jgi:hypothetical protein
VLGLQAAAFLLGSGYGGVGNQKSVQIAHHCSHSAYLAFDWQTLNSRAFVKNVAKLRSSSRFLPSICCAQLRVGELEGPKDGRFVRLLN